MTSVASCIMQMLNIILLQSILSFDKLYFRIDFKQNFLPFVLQMLVDHELKTTKSQVH